MPSRVFYEPKKMSSDQLAYLKLEDLQRYITEMECIKQQAAEHNYDPQRWEVEIAYAQRELGLRQVAFDIHQQYSEQLLQQELQEEADFLRQEASLPVVNFDNIKRGNR